MIKLINQVNKINLSSLSHLEGFFKAGAETVGGVCVVLSGVLIAVD